MRQLNYGARGLVTVFTEPVVLAEATAMRMLQIAEDAIAARGEAHLVLSGGSTPIQVAEVLRQPPFRDADFWSSTHFYWGDERWVPRDSPENNAGVMIEVLFSHLPGPVGGIHPMQTEDMSIEESAKQYEAEIRNLVPTNDGMPTFDLVLLGMGNDGHTASLFPYSSALHERIRLVTPTQAPALHTDRLTMTAPLLNAAHRVLFLATGRGKAARLEDVLEGQVDSEAFPAQMIRPEPGGLQWFVDEAAAAQLNCSGAATIVNDAERLLRLATAAAARVSDGQTIGLGSGTTAEAFIAALGVRIRQEGLTIQGVATSERTVKAAELAGVPLVEFSGARHFEIGFDGADEIDPELNLIKGRGGALFREKIVALACDRWIIVAADEKLVSQLGSRIGLPVEVTPFGWESTAKRIAALVGEVTRRMTNKVEPFVTDNGNFILDCYPGLIGDAALLANRLKTECGVVEHGLFIALADEAMVVDRQGTVRTITQS